MTSRVAVELTEDDIALAASIVRAHAYEVSVVREFKSQEKQCMRIAEALCNAQVLVEGACYCCGKGSSTLLDCVECGELLCQDCASPTGSHVCDLPF